MKHIKKIILLFFFSSLLIFAQNKVTTDSTNNYLNKEVTVKGLVSQVSTPKSGVIYLNMDGKYPNNKLSVVILKRDTEKFPDVNKFEGKKIEITGILQEYKGKLEILLKNPDQIKIIE